MCQYVDPRDSIIRLIDDVVAMDPEEGRRVLLQTKKLLQQGLDTHWARHDAGFLAIMTEAEKDELRGHPYWKQYAEAIRKSLALIEKMI